MVKEIPLTKGRVALVDDEDYEHLMQWKWHLYNKGYANRTIEAPREAGGKRKKTGCQMHRYIMNAPKGSMIDHINGDKLDNRKENLRFCTDQQNKMNCPPRKKYKGASRVKSCHNRWEVQIRVNGKKLYIGMYDSEEKAALAYNEAAKKYFGEFAWLNKISIS